jgi:hypothetical protein
MAFARYLIAQRDTAEAKLAEAEGEIRRHGEQTVEWHRAVETERTRALKAESKLARIAGVLDDDERSSVILAVIRGIIYEDKEAGR